MVELVGLTCLSVLVHRGGGLGLVLASAGFGMLTAPIMELHDQKGYFLHHVIFACCTLICIICILLLPETRYQPLPETLADGESYTRQPLLPPRKPGEQHFLLTKSDSRDYARVHETPLHEAAATVVSTMDSTASSAIDITLPSGYVEEDVATQAAADSAKPAAVEDVEASPAVPVGDNLTADRSTEDHPVEGQPALDATEPIQLTYIEAELPQDSSTPLLTSSTRAPRATSPTASSPRIGSPRDSSPRTGSPRDSSPRTDSPRDGSPRASSPGHSPVISDLIPALTTAPPDTEAVSPAKIEPPAPVLMTDSVPVAKSDSPGPDLRDSSLPHPVACAPLIDASSLAAESPHAPAASDPDSPPVMETNASLVNDIAAPLAEDIPSHGLTDPASSPAHLVNDLLVSPPPPTTDSSTPPAVDAAQLTLVDSPIPPSIDSLPATISPIPPSSPPLSRDSPSPPPVIPPPSMNSSTAPGSPTTCHVGAAAPPSPLALVDLTTPLGTDASQDLAVDSVTASPPPSPPGTPQSFSMDCTVSSPVDSGLTAADAATANGVASS